MKKFFVLKCWMFCFEGFEGFSCCKDAILIQNILIFFQLLFFSQTFWSSKPWIRTWICVLKNADPLAKTLPIPKIPSDDVFAYLFLLIWGVFLERVFIYNRISSLKSCMAAGHTSSRLLPLLPGTNMSAVID
jgi:hypothetical protein